MCVSCPWAPTESVAGRRLVLLWKCFLFTPTSPPHINLAHLICSFLRTVSTRSVDKARLRHVGGKRIICPLYCAFAQQHYHYRAKVRSEGRWSAAGIIWLDFYKTKKRTEHKSHIIWQIIIEIVANLTFKKIILCIGNMRIRQNMSIYCSIS